MLYPRVNMKYYSLVMVAAISFVFALQLAFGITEYFILSSSEVISKPYTLLTSIFLHANLLHLGYNMFALALFGLVLESVVGEKKFLAVFFSTGLAASIAASVFYPASLGASGAVFGVTGSLVVLRPRMTVFALGVPMPLIVAGVVWLLLDLAGVFFPGDVANTAHIAGLFAGIAIGLTWLKKFREPFRKSKKKKIMSEKELQEWEKAWMK